VYVTYNYNYKTSRFTTGVSVTKSSDFDKKRGCIRSKVINSEELNRLILFKQNQIEDIIKDALFRNIDPTSDYIKLILKQKSDDANRLVTDNVIDHLNNWFNDKKKAIYEKPMRERKTNTLTTYRNLLNHYTDFETFKGYNLTFPEIVDLKTCKSFINFMQRERETKDNANYITKGAIAVSTAERVFRNFKMFLKDMQDAGYVEDIPQKILKYKFKKPSAVRTTLTPEEVAFLWNYDFEGDERLERARDITVFGCHVGVRISDLETLKKTDFRNLKDKTGTDYLVLKKKSVKSNETLDFEVPVSDIAKTILNKYNYSFNDVSRDKLRLAIKDMLKKTGKFNEPIDVNGKEIPKWKNFSFHDCRRSFCTNLLNANTPLNVIMRFSGHRHISSLQRYLNMEAPINYDYINRITLPYYI